MAAAEAVSTISVTMSEILSTIDSFLAKEASLSRTRITHFAFKTTAEALQR